MKSLCWLTLAALLLVAPRSLAQSGEIGAEETHVLAMLHHANQVQIDAGGLTTSRARSPKVKRYGVQLVKDHQQADEILCGYARRKGAEIREPPAARSEAEQQDAEREAQAVEKLRELDGAEFDRAFLACMVDDHRGALQRVRNARNQVKDEKLRSMLNRFLPVLQQHAALAQKLQHDLAGQEGQ